MEGALCATPPPLHPLQDVELFASRATEVGGQLDLLLDLIRAAPSLRQPRLKPFTVEKWESLILCYHRHMV